MQPSGPYAFRHNTKGNLLIMALEDVSPQLAKGCKRHEPDPRTVLDRQGAVGSFLDMFAYPLTARCSICGEVIRSAAYFVNTAWNTVEGDDEIARAVREL